MGFLLCILARLQQLRSEPGDKKNHQKYQTVPTIPSSTIRNQKVTKKTRQQQIAATRTISIKHRLETIFLSPFFAFSFKAISLLTNHFQVIYTVFNNDFRRAFKKILFKWMKNQELLAETGTNLKSQVLSSYKDLGVKFLNLMDSTSLLSFNVQSVGFVLGGLPSIYQ